MRLWELDEANLRVDVLVWLISKGLSRVQADRYIDKVGLEIVKDRMDQEIAQVKNKADRILGSFNKRRKIQTLRNQGRVSYSLDPSTKDVMVDGSSIGTIMKTENGWAGDIAYNNINYSIGPASIMKVQDQINRIVYKI